MWGLLYPLIIGGAKLIKGVQDTIENEEFKQKYRHDDAGTYYDNKMRLHDQKTGHIVRYEKDLKTGDVYVKDCENGQRLRNLTQNAVEAHYQEERQKFLEGKTARTYVQYGKDDHHNDKCMGVRYKDLKTGKVSKQEVRLQSQTFNNFTWFEYNYMLIGRPNKIIIYECPDIHRRVPQFNK